MLRALKTAHEHKNETPEIIHLHSEAGGRPKKECNKPAAVQHLHGPFYRADQYKSKTMRRISVHRRRADTSPCTHGNAKTAGQGYEMVDFDRDGVDSGQILRSTPDIPITAAQPTAGKCREGPIPRDIPRPHGLTKYNMLDRLMDASNILGKIIHVNGKWHTSLDQRRMFIKTFVFSIIDYILHLHPLTANVKAATAYLERRCLRFVLGLP